MFDNKYCTNWTLYLIKTCPKKLEIWILNAGRFYVSWNNAEDVTKWLPHEEDLTGGLVKIELNITV